MRRSLWLWVCEGTLTHSDPIGSISWTFVTTTTSAIAWITTSFGEGSYNKTLSSWTVNVIQKTYSVARQEPLEVIEVHSARSISTSLSSGQNDYGEIFKVAVWYRRVPASGDTRKVQGFVRQWIGTAQNCL